MNNAVLRLDCYDQLARAHGFMPTDPSIPVLLRNGSRNLLTKDCEVKRISAAEARSGREETLIRCTIPLVPESSQYGIAVARVIVEPDLVYLHHSGSRACGYGPKLSVDGRRIDNKQALVKSVIPALGAPQAINAMLNGRTADIQEQARWPNCTLTTHTVSLLGLEETAEDAQVWVRERKDLLDN